MPDLPSWLRENCPQLTASALNRLQPAERLQPDLEAQFDRFYDGLARCLEAGSPEVLGPVLEAWAALRPTPPGDERVSLAPLLYALRASAWEALVAQLPPTEALPAIQRLEPLFVQASLQLTQLEIDTRLMGLLGELSQAQAEIELLDKSKSDFIAVAAHELKTPLTLIEGYAQLVGAELPSGQFPRVSILLRGLHNGTQRLKEIIEDMIDASLIDNHLLALNFEVVDLRALITELQHDLAPAFQQRRLHFDARGLDAELTTFADRLRLRQVFYNLLENAVKYTPDGGRITVSARSLAGFFDLSVTDTGIGIAPENHHRIFEKFATLGDASLHSSGKTKFKGGGAGLGLSIARGLIVAHGGALWVESPGHDEVRCPGSTFHVMLPQRTQPPASSEPQLYQWARDPRPWRKLGTSQERP